MMHFLFIGVVLLQWLGVFLSQLRFMKEYLSGMQESPDKRVFL